MRLHLRRSCRLPGVVRFVVPVAYSQVIPKVPWCKFRRGLCLSFGRPLFDHVRPVSPLACASQSLSLRFFEPVTTLDHSHSFTAAGARTMKKVDPKFVRQRSLLDVSWPPRAGSEPVQIVKMTMVHITHGIISIAPLGTKVR